MSHGEPIPVKVATEKQADPIPVKNMVAGSWREMIIRWLFDQSVSTVLLVLIFGAIVHGVPNYVLPSIREGYKSNSDALEKTTKLYLDARERETKLIMDVHERDRQAFERAVQVMERRP